MSYYNSKVVKWVRVAGYGVSLQSGRLMFSEREGYTRYYRVWPGWRLKFLTPRTNPLGSPTKLI